MIVIAITQKCIKLLIVNYILKKMFSLKIRNALNLYIVIKEN